MAMEVYRVFTPSSPAIETFVNRKFLENQFLKAMNTPGKQIIVFGPTGSGKSTLILNKYNIVYKNIIKSVCQRKTSFDDLIQDAYDQLNVFYLKESQKGQTGGIRGEASSSFWKLISGKISGNYEHENVNKFNRIVEFQLNERNLSKILKESKSCWVIEDFHKIPKNEKEMFADSLKLFTDDNSQVIAIGAVNSASEVLFLNEEMNNRIAEIRVPLMSDEELLSIIDRGASKLNIEFDDQLSYFIARFSNGYGANCHQLCLNLCESEKIFTRQRKRKTYGLESFKSAINAYLFNQSDSLLSKIKKAIKKDCYNVEVRETIIIQYLESLEDTINVDFLHSQLGFSKSEIQIALDELTELDNGKIFEKEYNSVNYTISNPFLLAYCAQYFEESISANVKLLREEFMQPTILTNCKAIRFIMSKAYDESKTRSDYFPNKASKDQFGTFDEINGHSVIVAVDSSFHKEIQKKKGGFVLLQFDSTGMGGDFISYILGSNSEHFIFFCSSHLKESQEIVIWGMAKIFGGFQGAREDAEKIWYVKSEQLFLENKSITFNSRKDASNQPIYEDEVIALEIGKVKLFGKDFIPIRKGLGQRVFDMLSTRAQNIGNLYIDLSVKNQILQFLDDWKVDYSEVFNEPGFIETYSSTSYSNKLIILLIRSNEINDLKNKFISDLIKEKLSKLNNVILFDSASEEVSEKEFSEIKNINERKLVIHLTGNIDISKASNALLQKANINKKMFSIIQVILPETISFYVKITNYEARVDFRKKDHDKNMLELLEIVQNQFSI